MDERGLMLESVQPGAPGQDQRHEHVPNSIDGHAQEADGGLGGEVHVGLEYLVGPTQASGRVHPSIDGRRAVGLRTERRLAVVISADRTGSRTRNKAIFGLKKAMAKPSPKP